MLIDDDTFGGVSVDDPMNDALARYRSQNNGNGATTQPAGRSAELPEAPSPTPSTPSTGSVPSMPDAPTFSAPAPSSPADTVSATPGQTATPAPLPVVVPPPMPAPNSPGAFSVSALATDDGRQYLDDGANDNTPYTPYTPPTPTAAPAPVPTPAAAPAADMPADTYSWAGGKAGNTAYDNAIAGGNKDQIALQEKIKQMGLNPADVQFGSDGSVMYGSGPNAGHVIPGFGANAELGGLLSDATYGASETGVFDGTQPADPNPAAKQAAYAAAHPATLQDGKLTGQVALAPTIAPPTTANDAGTGGTTSTTQIPPATTPKPPTTSTTPPTATPTGTPPSTTPPATTPAATSSAPQANAMSQALVLRLLSQLMGDSSNNVGFADPSAAGGAANPDAGDVGQFLSAKLTAIDPNNDLRDKMITPATDDLTEQARQHMADAQNNLSSFDRAQAIEQALKAFSPDATATGIDSAPSGRLKALQDQVDAATSSLNGIDRQALAKQMYETWKAETDPEYDLLVRNATKRYAAAGGLGSGGLRTSYGDLTRVRLNDETNKKNQLIQQAIGDSITDALNKQQRLADLEGQLSGEEANRRNELRTDQDRMLSQFNNNRDFASNFAGQKSQDLLNALSGASSVFGQTATEETNRRQELRGERDYQVGQEKDAFDRALAEYNAEQGAQKDRFSQGMQLLNVAGMGNPANVLASLGSQGGLDAQTIAALASALGQRSAAGGGSTAAGAPAAGGNTQSILDSILATLPKLGVQTTPAGA